MTNFPYSDPPCPVCGRSIAVSGSTTYRRHKVRQSANAMRCPGSGKTPAEARELAGWVKT